MDDNTEKKSITTLLKEIKNKVRDELGIAIETKPVQSDNDKKQYTAIKLDNGLTALLISDVEHLIDPTELVCDDENGYSDNGLSGSESTLSYTSSAIAENFNKRGKLAACALTVRAGSFNDSVTTPGLAHFLEHMICNSVKFPQENDFKSYIAKKGGTVHAVTDCETTTYYFTCKDKHLCHAMGRFSNFFVTPLMKEDSILKEREAIESEFKMNSFTDSARVEQLLGSMASIHNPAHKFTWDNLITLKEGITDDVLLDALIDFWKNNYSANNMTLAVQARLPIEVLGLWIANYFSDIPLNHKRNKFPVIESPFKMNLFNKIYTVMPIDNLNYLRLTWALPPVMYLYKSKPLSYLSFLIQHKGRGSLFSYLQEKLWAFDINAELNANEFENNSVFSLFVIDIDLTDKGLENVEQIIELIFSYIALLKREGPSETIFRELQLMNEMEFRYQPETEPCDYVQKLSQNMQIYPTADYLTGDTLLFEYKPDEIMKIVNLMTLDNVNIMILSKSAAEKVILDQTEPWFNTKYMFEDIPQNLFNKCLKHEIDPKLFIPKRNIYMPCHFDITPLPTVIRKYPKNVLKNEYREVWYKQDTEFKLPYGYIKVYMISPIASLFPQTSVMCDIFIAMFQFLITKETYPASLAGLYCSVSNGDNGIEIAINGFNHKILLLLKTVLIEMTSLAKYTDIAEDIFQMVKNHQKRQYSNATLDSSQLGDEIRLSILCTNYWHSANKLEVIDDITIEKFQEFKVNLFENLYIKCLIQGNISDQNVIEITSKLIEITDYNPITVGTYPRTRIHSLPVTEQIIRVQAFNKYDRYCNIVNYYQSGLNNFEDSCKAELIMLIMEEPLHNAFNTAEQIAYDVDCNIKDTHGVLGFTIRVKFQANKFDVEYIEQRITEFIKIFKTDLEDMTSKVFNQIKEVLKITKKEYYNNMEDEVSRNWNEIISDEYLFNRTEQEVEFIETLSLSEFQIYFENLFGKIEYKKPYGFTNSSRKLSIQVEAEDFAKNESVITGDKVQNNHIKVNFKSSLKIQTNDENVDKNYIEDVEQFKTKLFIHPYRNYNMIKSPWARL